MLFVVQFPIADFRQFRSAELDGYLLPRPAWPGVVVDDDFVRSFGSIRERPRGGIGNWIGEHSICRAQRALRYRDLGPLDLETTRVKLEGVFRRFYFDGAAVAKFEVGISVEASDAVSKTDAEELVRRLLDLDVEVPDPAGTPSTVRLVDAGKPLARLYALSSVETRHRAAFDQVWCEAGTPVAAIVRKRDVDEALSLPFPRRELPTKHDFSLAYVRVPVGGRTLGLWEFTLVPKALRDASPNVARMLRIALLRLHAEKACLLLVLQRVRAGTIAFERNSRESDRFQRYLAETLKRIRRDQAKADGLLETDVIETVKELEDVVSPGQRSQIVQAIELLDIRPNIERNVREYMERGVVNYIYVDSVHNQTMGDHVNIENVGGIVNYKSTLRSTKQKVEGVTVVQGNDKERLKELVSSLDEELERVAETDPEGAQKVAEAADRVMDEAAREKPDRKFLELSADGLKEAAQAVATIAPSVVTVATQIARAVVGAG